MAGRPRIFDQEELLAKSIALFWKNGFEATTTNDLLKEVNLNKGSLYNVFKSKKELFKAGFVHMEQKGLDGLEKQFESSKDPIGNIKTLFYNMVDASFEEDCKGCILGNSIVEFTGKDEELKQLAEQYLKRFESILETTLSNAQNNGLIQSSVPPALLSRHLINFWNGLNVTRRVYPDKKEMKDLIDLNLSFI
ncbi:TetR/AcrR family transcriptional regulator [Flammeovirga sp. EKP202]|uniref:TetR/AcrR family transcriptional regulator n=1 Tax=Flammeovirga sp. EKP202 TaxID=2770592 RepID=UPI00165EE642|nr:TetR/AcrR family transcriptional regulator [Flammeovirga sp. EKP202]MBD0405106.1 TetR/AcrR family transcriptional regulator [Flammeovirga sp. EKP202]